jgi:hypothetical protein
LVVITRPSNLREDLENEENILGDEHVDLPLESIKVGRVYVKKRSYDKTNVRTSSRIKFKRKFFNGWSARGNVKFCGSRRTLFFVNESIRDHQLYFIALLKTGRLNFVVSFHRI